MRGITTAPGKNGRMRRENSPALSCWGDDVGFVVVEWVLGVEELCAEPFSYAISCALSFEM